MDKRFKQVREVPVLLAEFCSHFDFKNCEFLGETGLPNFFSEFSQYSPDSFFYAFKISSFENGYGYFFNEKDYTKLGSDLLYLLANYSAAKNKKV